MEIAGQWLPSQGRCAGGRLGCAVFCRLVGEDGGGVWWRVERVHCGRVSPVWSRECRRRFSCVQKEKQPQWLGAAKNTHRMRIEHL